MSMHSAKPMGPVATLGPLKAARSCGQNRYNPINSSLFSLTTLEAPLHCFHRQLLIVLSCPKLGLHHRLYALGYA
jgi:hypothetical protein